MGFGFEGKGFYFMHVAFELDRPMIFVKNKKKAKYICLAIYNLRIHRSIQENLLKMFILENL